MSLPANNAIDAVRGLTASYGPIPFLQTYESYVARCVFIIACAMTLAGCVMPSFWVDDTDFLDNIPDKSIIKYGLLWGYETVDERNRKERDAFRKEFLKAFPVGSSASRAKEYLIGIGAFCAPAGDVEGALDVCVYSRKYTVYRGYFKGSFGGEKTRMHETKIYVTYKVTSKEDTLTGIDVDISKQPMPTNKLNLPPEVDRIIEEYKKKEIHY